MTSHLVHKCTNRSHSAAVERQRIAAGHLSIQPQFGTMRVVEDTREMAESDEDAPSGTKRSRVHQASSLWVSLDFKQGPLGALEKHERTILQRAQLSLNTFAHSFNHIHQNDPSTAWVHVEWFPRLVEIICKKVLKRQISTLCAITY